MSRFRTLSPSTSDALSLVDRMAHDANGETWPLDPSDRAALLAVLESHGALLTALKAHDAYMLDAGYSGPDSDALHPKAAENWRRALAAIATAEGR